MAIVVGPGVSAAAISAFSVAHHRGLVHEDRAGAQAARGRVSSIQRSPSTRRAEVLEGVEVGVEAAAADEVAARRRHLRLAEAREQRPGEQERGPDLLGELLVDREVGDAARRRGASCCRRTHATSTPSRSSSAICASVSRIRGTWCRTSSSSVSRQAARIGRAAFLLPAAVELAREGHAALDDEFLHGSG